jgi:hypothetical protein
VLICTIALLVNLLEERGLLEDGIYLDSLSKALRLFEDEDAAYPKARVLKEFVRNLNNIEVFPVTFSSALGTGYVSSSPPRSRRKQPQGAVQNGSRPC